MPAGVGAGVRAGRAAEEAGTAPAGVGRAAFAGAATLALGSHPADR